MYIRWKDFKDWNNHVKIKNEEKENDKEYKKWNYLQNTPKFSNNFAFHNNFPYKNF